MNRSIDAARKQAASSPHELQSRAERSRSAWRAGIGLDKVPAASPGPKVRPPAPSTANDRAEMSRNPMIVRTLPALRRAIDSLRARKATIALVPTMGALHDGHM